MLIYNSPRLIAVSHVLHRLLMPRHSPYALFRLNFLLANYFSSLASCAVLSQIIFTVVSFLHISLLAKFVVFLHHYGKTLFFSFRSPRLFRASGEQVFSQLSVRFFSLYSVFNELSATCVAGGLKWTRTIDLALIRRAL